MTTLLHFCKRRNLTIEQLIRKKGFTNKEDILTFISSMGLTHDTDFSEFFESLKIQDSPSFSEALVIPEKESQKLENQPVLSGENVENVKSSKKSHSAFTKVQKRDKGE
jgi:hypothetical protein